MNKELIFHKIDSAENIDDIKPILIELLDNINDLEERLDKIQAVDKVFEEWDEEWGQGH